MSELSQSTEAPQSPVSENIPTPPGDAPPKKLREQEPGIDQASRDVAAMSYVWIMSVIVLIFRRDNEFVHFHAKQAAVLFIISLLTWAIPGVIGKSLTLVVAGAMIYGFIQAARGVRYRFPIIADIVEKKIDLSKWRLLLKKSPGGKISDDITMAKDPEETLRDIQKQKEEQEDRRHDLAKEITEAKWSDSDQK